MYYNYITLQQQILQSPWWLHMGMKSCPTIWRSWIVLYSSMEMLWPILQTQLHYLNILLYVFHEIAEFCVQILFYNFILFLIIYRILSYYFSTHGMCFFFSFTGSLEAGLSFVFVIPDVPVKKACMLKFWNQDKNDKVNKEFISSLENY